MLTISTEDKSFDKILKLLKIKIYMEHTVYILMKQKIIKILKVII